LKPATENGDPPDAGVRGLCIDILPKRSRKDTIHSVPCWLSQSTIVPGHLSETGGEPLSWSGAGVSVRALINWRAKLTEPQEKLQ
jgi:hypothetical protein